MRRRSNRRSSWINVRVPHRLHLIPVLSDGKDTGTAGAAAAPFPAVVMVVFKLPASGSLTSEAPAAVPTSRNHLARIWSTVLGVGDDAG